MRYFLLILSVLTLVACNGEDEEKSETQDSSSSEETIVVDAPSDHMDDYYGGPTIAVSPNGNIGIGMDSGVTIMIDSNGEVGLGFGF